LNKLIYNGTKERLSAIFHIHKDMNASEAGMGMLLVSPPLQKCLPGSNV
jgi:hypothetical protein